MPFTCCYCTVCLWVCHYWIVIFLSKLLAWRESEVSDNDYVTLTQRRKVIDLWFSHPQHLVCHPFKSTNSYYITETSCEHFKMDFSLLGCVIWGKIAQYFTEMIRKKHTNQTCVFFTWRCRLFECRLKASVHSIRSARRMSGELQNPNQPLTTCFL